MSDSIALEPEQEQLFASLVEAWRSVPRNQRQDFMYLRSLQSDRIQGNGFAAKVLSSDVQHVMEVGLLRLTNYHQRGSGFNFYSPPARPHPTQ